MPAPQRPRRAMLAVGGAFTGIECYGPFESTLAAEEWGTANFPSVTETTVVELIDPKEVE